MRKSKFKVRTSVGKTMASVFKENEGILLGEILKIDAEISSEQCVQMLKKLKQ